jgi:NAD(P)-dependent dehydrogenase (short-subunit alcohol dehydrogenase family)
MKTPQELFTLEGKTAIVTGALGLIGKKHCEALSAAGATVVVADINADKAVEFAASLQDGRSFGLGIDVTNKERLEECKAIILNKTSRIDILVNNAAINDMVENPDAAAELSKFENYPLDLFRKVLDVNVTGMFLCSQVFGAEMAKNKSGSIINIASTYGMVGPDQSIYIKPDGTQPFFKSPAYPTTKGAVLNFTRFLAAYWGTSGVRVNTLSPGGVENGQDAYFIQNYSKKTPLGRMAQPNDYQGALVFLASDASQYMTGANVVVDGGWTAW